MNKDGTSDIATLMQAVKACRLCADPALPKPLPHAPRPILIASSRARLVIAGQAPGTRVHQSGRPFTDPSGDRLRDWLRMDEATFYDSDKLAIVPMGFCFPGLDAKGGDLPPRKECRVAWHDQVFAAMPQIELILAIGQYAQAYHLGRARKKSLTETVSHWRDYLAIPGQLGVPVLPLPHPSWRNNAWIKKHPWFEEELLPVLREHVQALVA